MPPAPHKEVSAAPFPFVRQFTAPPFSMGIEDAKLRGQLFLAALKKSGKKTAPAKSKAAKKRPAKKVPAKKLPKTATRPRRGK